MLATLAAVFVGAAATATAATQTHPHGVGCGDRVVAKHHHRQASAHRGGCRHRGRQVNPVIAQQMHAEILSELVAQMFGSWPVAPPVYDQPWKPL